ncbi:MAG: alpha/beta fold hydrolase, partial [Pirellulaceae bacterium]
PISGDAREHYIAQLDWAGDADHIVLQQFNRLQNTNLLLLYHRKSGELRTLVTETDKAWVENSNSHLTWINDHHSLLWLSEREGWQHVYRIERKDGRTEAVTHGSFDVLSIDGRDERGGWLYYTASPDNPTQRYLYRVRWDGQETSRVSPDAQPGTHTYDLSPDARWAVHSYSTFDKPPVTALISLPDHKVVRVLADNRALQKKLKALKPTPSEFFRVDIGDGVQLDGWCVLPAGFDPGRKYPALIYVYGEPAGQTVLDRWTGKRQLWHRLLAQQGYLVFSFDNRGTPAPRGSAWRKSIYRQAGVLAAADQAAALRATAQARPYLDAQRVAIWGWSGGGSMTLNAILRYPDLYQAAMAVAPVPNLTFYDTIYEERYMGLPSDNAEGYRLGSAVTFARQLEGELLIVHGTGDDNVHYQGTETLIDELIAYNKQFSAFAYPSRSHSISERKNTTRHLYGLLTRFLHDKIDAGAR